MQKPNVVLVITDDQGYGDLGCNGNPWLKTPNIDAFASNAVRCNDFHVSPLCAPTRGALMSGRNPLKNGAWATCWGRSILGREEVTLADIFKANGYRTGLFGKWHLGDNYPYRPQDRGFDRVVAHKGGGVGQTPDFWGNNYFDDTYFSQGVATKYDGYCTDIWFEQALDFMDEADEPFFAYVATNAPHSPYFVADRYAEQYRGNPDIPEPEFYGMITNIDENFGRLVNHLEKNGMIENTVLIFMTDNGTSGGAYGTETCKIKRGYNAGMRGKKRSYYEGGHRVPFYISHPGGGISNGDIDTLLAHIDVLPTLVDICGLDASLNLVDGASFGDLLRGDGQRFDTERAIVLQNQQFVQRPDKWLGVVMQGHWRLVYGTELFDLSSDPGQEFDVSGRYPEKLIELREIYETFWADVAPRLDEAEHIPLGCDEENPTRLDAMDVLGDVAWDQPHIRDAIKTSGQWHVDVTKPGMYKISLRRWPEEAHLPIGGVPLHDEMIRSEQVGVNKRHGASGESKAITPSHARLRFDETEYWIKVDPEAEEAVFEIGLDSYRGILQADFINESYLFGAYYVYVERLTS